MMKIHTTQNLNTLGNQPAIINVSSKEFRLNQQLSQKSPIRDTITFGKKCGTNSKNAKVLFDKAVKQTKEKAENIAKENKKNRLRSEKDPVGGAANKFLEWTDSQEVMIQSVISLLLCTIARPLTLVAMGNDKTKNDMAYASAHSISSGIWGFIVPALFIRPLAKGYNYAKDNANLFMPLDKLKKRYPHLDIKNPLNFTADGKLKSLKECLDIYGNKFVADTKDVFKVPLPKHSSEISKETYEKYIDPDTKQLKTLKDAFIALIEESKIEAAQKERTFFDFIRNKKATPKYYPLEFVEAQFLEKTFPELDIASIEKNGKRLLPHEWKLKDGSSFKLDINNIYISNWDETNKAIPLTAGRMRTCVSRNGKKIKSKDVCYQKNGIDGKLGSPLTQDVMDADKANAVQDKLGGWLGDIVIAYPRATATIAIIPLILKNVFHLEKKKKQPITAETGKEAV